MKKDLTSSERTSPEANPAWIRFFDEARRLADVGRKRAEDRRNNEARR